MFHNMTIKQRVFYMVTCFILHYFENQFEDMIEQDLLGDAFTSPDVT